MHASILHGVSLAISLRLPVFRQSRVLPDLSPGFVTGSREVLELGFFSRYI